MLSSDLQKLSVTGLVTLYELDATNLGAGIFRWHGHISREEWHKIMEWAGNTHDFAGDDDRWAGAIFDDDADPDARESTVFKDIIWAGQTYTPMPIKSDGLEMRGDGKASTPSLALANNIDGLQGAVSALCLQYDDFCGARLTVINTMAKYLDAANFTEGNPSANPNEYRKQVWYCEQKTSENASAVTFELSNPVDFEGAKIPSRDITSFCHWAVHGRYRGEECAYRGTAMFDAEGNPTDDAAKDACGARLTDCRIRNNEGRYGGFPSSSLIKG